MSISYDEELLFRLSKTQVDKLIADGLKVMLVDRELVVYSPATKESMKLALTKKQLQYMRISFPGLF
jgi:hypothetical protein